MLISLFNAKRPNGKRVPVTVNIEHLDITNTNDGELIYILILETSVLDINLNKIPPIYINNITKSTLQEELQNGLTLLAQKINWGLLEEDIYPPIIESINIPNNSVDVPIDSYINIDILDPLPASLIDNSTIKLIVNNIDITKDLKIIEKNNRVSIKWYPPINRN